MIDSNGAPPVVLRQYSLRATGGYLITPDPSNKLLHISLTGFWSDDIMTHYLRDLHLKTHTIMAAGAYRGALVDASHYAIQSREIAYGHSKAMKLARRMYGVRAALLTSQSRSKLQLRRMADETGQQAFDCPDDGMTWLLS